MCESFSVDGTKSCGPPGDLKSADLPRSLLGLEPQLLESTLASSNAVVGSGHGGMMNAKGFLVWRKQTCCSFWCEIPLGKSFWLLSLGLCSYPAMLLRHASNPTLQSHDHGGVLSAVHLVV